VSIEQAEASNLANGGVLFLKRKLLALRARFLGRGQTAGSVVALLTSNLASSVFTAAGGLLVARFLGPAQTGAFRVYTIPISYLIFLHLGTWDALGRQIPYYVGKEMPDEVQRLAGAAGAYNLFLCALVTLGFFLCAGYSLAHFDLQGGVGWLTQIVYCWGVYYGGYLTSTYRTLQNFVKLARIQAIQTLATFGMVFLLPLLGFYGLCLRLALPAFLALWLYHQNRPLRMPYRSDPKALKDLIRVGLPFSFWGNVYTSLWGATECALILHLSGVSALGLFSVAAVMGGAVNSLPMAIWQVLTPRIVSSLARDGSLRDSNRKLGWVSFCLAAIMILVALAGTRLLEFLVPLLVPKYVAGVPLMKVCLWIPVVNACSLPITTLFAAGKPWLYGRGVLVGALVFPAATFLLLPSTGGALAVVLGSLLGRVARTVAAYLDLALLTRREQ
jgi:O-antigen/teichoic acid export membrane protein